MPFYLAPKAAPNHERNCLLILLWLNAICQPLLSWFSKNLMLSCILVFLHTQLMTPNNFLKILNCQILGSYCQLQSLENVIKLETWDLIWLAIF